MSAPFRQRMHTVLGRPMSRRRLLAMAGRAGALTVVGGGLVAACAQEDAADPDTEPGPTDEGAQPGEGVLGDVPGPQPVNGGQYGGRISVGYGEVPRSFDPHVGSNVIDYDIMTQAVFFGSLYGFAGQSGGLPQPNIAAEMPAVSPDGLSLTFPIKEGAKFHNGREITVEDVKWSIERLLFPETEAWGVDYISAVVGYQDVVEGRTDELEGVEIVDSRTIRINLEHPDAVMTYALAMPQTTPVPREEVERLGEDFGTRPVGHGPFRVEEVDEAQQRMILTRFEDYHWDGLPYVDEIEVRWGLDSDVGFLQWENGDLDMLGNGVPPSKLGQVSQDPRLSARTVEVPVFNQRYAQINPRSEPLDDVRVRQALNYGLNREDFARVMFGASLPWGAPFPRSLDIPRGDFEGYTYDPERARDLLAEAGHADGLRLTLVIADLDPWPDIAQISQQQFQEIGVELNIEAVQLEALGDTLRGDNWQIVAASWYMVHPLASDPIDNIYTTGASTNFQQYSNPEVDELGSQARQEFDVERRGELYAQIERIIAEDSPSLWFDTVQFVAGHTERIHNYHYQAALGQYFDRLWIEE